MYKYYQKIGGNELWTVVRDDTDFNTIRPTFITVLSLDTIIQDDITREELDKVKYMGDMYFDLDDEENVANSIAGAQDLVRKLQEQDLRPTDFRIFLSGKKGVHITVPMAVFLDRVSPLSRLPAIYKEFAFSLAVDTLDFKVYTARKGRMLRTCYNIRENGKYKVPVSVDELLSLTPVLYDQFCSSPRTISDEYNPKFRAKFSLLFATARQRVTKVKPRKIAAVDQATVKRHEPIVQRILDGEAASGAGFNKIAIQLAIYARHAGWTVEDLIHKATKLLENHASDGGRYNSRGRREHELRRMCAYVEDNATYEYAIEPLKALLGKDDLASGEFDSIDQSGGVILKNGGYWVVGVGEAADRLIFDAYFADAQVLHDRKEGSIACLVASIVLPNGDRKKVSIERQDFGSSSSLHRLTSSFGVSFMGTDIHARGIYEIMLRNIEPNKYVTDCEGLDAISIPASPFEEARKPFLVWSDGKGVRLPKHISDLGINIIFQGYPDVEGVCKTDLTNAPPLRAWLEEKGNKERMTTALTNFLKCHEAEVLAKTIGWSVACFWRQMFQLAYGKFPLLHVNGTAGAGKSELIGSLMSLFYYRQDPRIMTPTSTPFAILSAIGGSASIPIVVDEYKPQEMAREKHALLKLMFRDAYNMRETARGGGNRTKDNFGALNTVKLSAPVVFIAEAMESETALLERVVLVTIRRQPALMGARTYGYFKIFYDNRDVMSVLGHNIAAHTTSTGSVEQLRIDFDAIYNAARIKFLPQPTDQDTLSEEEILKKSNGRERLVFNTSVAAFGLQKFDALLKAIYGEEYNALFGEKMQELTSKVYNRMDDTSKSTMPEYLKVLTAMSDMSRLPMDNTSALVDGTEYSLIERGGFLELHIATRISYAKYRMWLRAQNQNPLYNNDTAFAHSTRDAAQFVRDGSGTRNLKVDTAIFDYAMLLRSGMPAFAGKAVAP